MSYSKQENHPLNLDCVDSLGLPKLNKIVRADRWGIFLAHRK